MHYPTHAVRSPGCTVYIETVSPLSTLNRYQFQLGVWLPMRRYCRITRVSLLLFIPFFLQKYIETRLKYVYLVITRE
jgi:hypothetical protein